MLNNFYTLQYTQICLYMCECVYIYVHIYVSHMCTYKCVYICHCKYVDCQSWACSLFRA